jgi:hypothetical protein
MNELKGDCAKREYQVEQQLNIQEKVIEELEIATDSLRNRLNGILRVELEGKEGPAEAEQKLVTFAEKTRVHNSRIKGITQKIMRILDLCEL